MNQTLWSRGAYQLEIISAHSERGLVNYLYKFCSEESTDFVNRWLVLNLPLRYVNSTVTTTVSTRTFCHSLNTNQSFVLTNQQNLSIPQNKICIGSWPDLFWAQALIISNRYCDQRVWFTRLFAYLVWIGIPSDIPHMPWWNVYVKAYTLVYNF